MVFNVKINVKNIVERYGYIRIFLGIFGVLLFILTIYGLNVLNIMYKLVESILNYWDEISRLGIGFLTIAIITYYLKAINIMFNIRTYLKNMDTIKSTENISDKLDKLEYKYMQSLFIFSMSSIFLYFIYSSINLPISNFIMLLFIFIVPTVFLIFLQTFKFYKYAKISKIISILVFIGIVGVSIKYFQYSSASYTLLHFCYLGGLFIGIAYYWNNLIYELGKFNCFIQFLLREYNELRNNAKYYFKLLKNHVIENYNHYKDEDIEINPKTDCFGTLNKIITIEEGFKNKILQNHKIIALYGNWGSGKSSIIRTLIERLDESRNFDEITEIKRLWESFKDFIHILKPPKEKHESIICIKFDAWEYENEENIAYALLCHIINELEKNADIKFGIRSIKNNLLKSGAVVLKSVDINMGIFNINLGCDIEKQYKEVENLKNGLNKISEILSENNKRLIVFIDELDRCERENILKFLASLKLFFTSGDNINYICAVDKDAVKEALEHKYNNGEKAEEYLEKIFNFSFNMPKKFNVEKFIMQYEFFNDEEIAKKLAKFFEAINFTNPRHLKKVLNKYDYLVKIKTSDKISEKLKNLIPDIICIDLECMLPTSEYYLKKYYPNQNLIKNIVKILKSGNSKNYLFDTIFVLYFIILYEFYPEKYLEIKNCEDKLNNYVNHFKYIGWNDEFYMDVEENEEYIRNKKNMVRYYVNYDLLNLQSIYLSYKILSKIDNPKELNKYLLLEILSENEVYIKYIENYIKLYPKLYKLKDIRESNYKKIQSIRLNEIDSYLVNAIKNGYYFDSLADKLLYPKDDGYFASRVLTSIINIKKEKPEDVDRLLSELEESDLHNLSKYLLRLLYGYNKKDIEKINEKMSELLSELEKTHVKKLNEELFDKLNNLKDCKTKEDLQKIASKLMNITNINRNLSSLIKDDHYDKYIWIFNRHLLNLINVFTPIIKNKIDYSIWDASLLKKEYKSGLYHIEENDVLIPDSRLLDIYSYNSYSYSEIKNTIKEDILSNIRKYIEQFEYKNNEILIDFCKYLISDEFFEIIKKENRTYNKKENKDNKNEDNEDYKFKTLFDMVETLL
ncbi:membrane protein of unknown function [Methanocaldococcus lauensis]|uniref:KAP NTPase domain-containing protein n=1 Tax=Methanocaldococcus lauensis TaxID=2546128 RepID=A0A8D6T0J2_9EURY|nr:P-loop NTPase fold protein [Methanocaldococcus lauensis]CAB3289272.1 membrane protein of unknown function [Methanocaldococcus lauensis]